MTECRQREKITSLSLFHTEVNKTVPILALFPLTQKAYDNRLSQEAVDVIGELLGTKPTWWMISTFIPCTYLSSLIETLNLTLFALV